MVVAGDHVLGAEIHQRADGAGLEGPAGTPRPCPTRRARSTRGQPGAQASSRAAIVDETLHDVFIIDDPSGATDADTFDGSCRKCMFIASPNRGPSPCPWPQRLQHVRRDAHERPRHLHPVPWSTARSPSISRLPTRPARRRCSPTAAHSCVGSGNFSSMPFSVDDRAHRVQHDGGRGPDDAAHDLLDRRNRRRAGRPRRPRRGRCAARRPCARR